MSYKWLDKLIFPKDSYIYFMDRQYITIKLLVSYK